MKVYLTPAQFDAVLNLQNKREASRDPRDLDTLIAYLSICTLENGGDFRPSAAMRGEVTEIEVINRPLTAYRLNPMNPPRGESP